MVGILDPGFTNQIKYYLVHQHLIYRAHLLDVSRIDNRKCLEANSKWTLHNANYQKSLKVNRIFKGIEIKVNG